MTATETKKQKVINALISGALLILTIMIALSLSKEMSVYVIEGMSIAVNCVIPSSFPFMIISDFYTHYGHPENIPFLGVVFSRALGIPKSAIGAFICGNIGGFPIGSKMITDLYAQGAIDKQSAERLIPLSSNPSFAFILGAVGLGLYSDFKIGIILLLSTYTSCIACAFITKSATHISNYSNKNIRQKYNFVSSVKNSGANSVALISFISIFSVVIGLVKKHIKSIWISYPIIMLCEVTNAVKIFSDNSVFSTSSSLFLSGFSLGFGGISVMLQSSIFAKENGISMKKYFFLKLLQGLLCGTISSVSLLVI